MQICIENPPVPTSTCSNHHHDGIPAAGNALQHLHTGASLSSISKDDTGGLV